MSRWTPEKSEAQHRLWLPPCWIPTSSHKNMSKRSDSYMERLLHQGVNPLYKSSPVHPYHHTITCCIILCHVDTTMVHPCMLLLHVLHIHTWTTTLFYANGEFMCLKTYSSTFRLFLHTKFLLHAMQLRHA